MAGQKFFLKFLGPKLPCFQPALLLFLSNKQAKSKKFYVLRAILKAFAGHIWPAGRMLCMPGLDYPSRGRVKVKFYKVNKRFLTDVFERRVKVEFYKVDKHF